MKISYINDFLQQPLIVHALTFTLLCIVTNLVYANNSEDVSEDFYDGKADGWFWYEEPPIEEVIEDKPEEITQAA